MKRMTDLGWELAGDYDPVMPPPELQGKPPIDPGMYGAWFQDIDGTPMFRPYTLPGSPYVNMSMFKLKEPK